MKKKLYLNTFFSAVFFKFLKAFIDDNRMSGIKEHAGLQNDSSDNSAHVYLLNSSGTYPR